MNRNFDVFLDSNDLLIPTDAVAALLVLDDGRYVMQLRDQKANIFYPGHWGLFGGAQDKDETEVEALRRELREELGFNALQVNCFVRLYFDLSSIGAGKVCRAVYEVCVTQLEFANFELGEGLACRAFTARNVLTKLAVTPYDSFAVWMHYARQRLSPPSAKIQAVRVPGAK
jgi:8-oxo-dGTP pyrophosphatase MutT (NUDIX family)